MRNVRNFWMRLRVDGRSSTVETGPAARDGSMRGVILQRHAGSVADVRLRVDCEAMGDKLRTWVGIDHDAPLPDGVTVWLDRANGERVALGKGDSLVLETRR